LHGKSRGVGAIVPGEPMLHQLACGTKMAACSTNFCGTAYTDHTARKCPSFQHFFKCKTTRHDNNFEAGITTKKCNFIQLLGDFVRRQVFCPGHRWGLASLDSLPVGYTNFVTLPASLGKSHKKHRTLYKSGCRRLLRQALLQNRHTRKHKLETRRLLHRHHEM